MQRLHEASWLDHRGGFSSDDVSSSKVVAPRPLQIDQLKFYQGPQMESVRFGRSDVHSKPSMHPKKDQNAN